MALGASLPVRVDADDPSVLVVDTDATGPHPHGSDAAA
jgi:hypothetical protein